MQYLVAKKSPKVAHLWHGSDTICRMYSTDGMFHDNYKVVDDKPDKIKTICLNCTRHRDYKKYTGKDAALQSVFVKKPQPVVYNLTSALIFKGDANLSLFSYLMEAGSEYRIAGQGYRIIGTCIADGHLHVSLKLV